MAKSSDQSKSSPGSSGSAATGISEGDCLRLRDAEAKLQVIIDQVDEGEIEVSPELERALQELAGLIRDFISEYCPPF